MDPSSILFSDAALAFIANDAPLFATAPYHQRQVDMVIAYRAVTLEGCENISSTGRPYLNAGDLSVPDDANWRSFDFCVRKGLYSGKGHLNGVLSTLGEEFEV
jgi:hypothetical protein